MQFDWWGCYEACRWTIGIVHSLLVHQTSLPIYLAHSPRPQCFNPTYTAKIKATSQTRNEQFGSNSNEGPSIHVTSPTAAEPISSWGLPTNSSTQSNHTRSPSPSKATRLLGIDQQWSLSLTLTDLRCWRSAIEAFAMSKPRQSQSRAREADKFKMERQT